MSPDSTLHKMPVTVQNKCWVMETTWLPHLQQHQLSYHLSWQWSIVPLYSDGSLRLYTGLLCHSQEYKPNRVPLFLSSFGTNWDTEPTTHHFLERAIRRIPPEIHMRQQSSYPFCPKMLIPAFYCMGKT